MSDDQAVPVYVSPDGDSEMPVRSPATQINLESRGWKRKDGGQPATTNPNPQAPAADTSPKPKSRRQAADE